MMELLELLADRRPGWCSQNLGRGHGLVDGLGLDQRRCPEGAGDDVTVVCSVRVNASWSIELSREPIPSKMTSSALSESNCRAIMLGQLFLSSVRISSWFTRGLRPRMAMPWEALNPASLSSYSVSLIAPVQEHCRRP